MLVSVAYPDPTLVVVAFTSRVVFTWLLLFYWLQSFTQSLLPIQLVIHGQTSNGVLYSIERHHLGSKGRIGWKEAGPYASAEGSESGCSENIPYVVKCYAFASGNV